MTTSIPKKEKQNDQSLSKFLGLFNFLDKKVKKENKKEK